MLPMQRTQVKWPLAEEEVEQGNGQGGALMGHGPDEGDTRWGGGRQGRWRGSLCAAALTHQKEPDGALMVAKLHSYGGFERSAHKASESPCWLLCSEFYLRIHEIGVA